MAGTYVELGDKRKERLWWYANVRPSPQSIMFVMKMILDSSAACGWFVREWDITRSLCYSTTHKVQGRRDLLHSSLRHFLHSMWLKE